MGVNYDNLSEINYTQQGHWLATGWVSNWVVQTGSNIYTNTWGQGVNTSWDVSEANVAIGGFFFGNVSPMNVRYGVVGPPPNVIPRF